MNSDTNTLSSPEQVGQRWSAILTRRYPGAFAAKRIARDLGRDVRTVQAWLSGQAPYLHVAIHAAMVWGDPLILFELAGLAPPDQARLGRDLATLRGDLAQLHDRLDALGQEVKR